MPVSVPSLTVLLSRTQLAVMAFAALEALIRKEDGARVDYTIPTHLVMRASTRAI
jgi:DNA-binding LacI/PurR family transcriptional regulator